MPRGNDNIRCDKCRYHHAIPEPTPQPAPPPDPPPTVLECRKYSASLSQIDEANWPIVQPFDWCGEYVAIDVIAPMKKETSPAVEDQPI